jgi:hypothetical protein
MVDLGQPEIENLGVPAIGHENIRGFDVPVHDSLPVRRIQRVGKLRSDLQQRLDRERLALDAMFQRPAFQKLHRDEGLTFVLIDFMDGADIRVIEGGRGARFPLESLEGLVVSRQRLRQELQRDESTEPGVFGFEHHAHAAATKLLEDAIVGDGVSNHQSLSTS